MKVLLVDVDSKIPNLALMKLSAWHRDRGDTTFLNRCPDPDKVYISCIYTSNGAKARGLQLMYDDAELGGSGVDLESGLPERVEHICPDYELYPGMDYSMGFTSRGCIRNCAFCVVPVKERWAHAGAARRCHYIGGRTGSHGEDNPAEGNSPAAGHQACRAGARDKICGGARAVIPAVDTLLVRGQQCDLPAGRDAHREVVSMTWKESVEWGRPWNPITGCGRDPGCSYCYARRFAKRLRGRYGYPEDEPFRPTFHPDRLDIPLRRKTPTLWFVGSMAEIFGPGVRPDWVSQVLIKAAEAQELGLDHRFLFPTKCPEGMKNYRFSSNCWCGITAEDQAALSSRAPDLMEVDGPEFKFYSLEPLHGMIRDMECVDWVIIGAQTGPGAVPPTEEQIDRALLMAKGCGSAVFMKDNLRPYWKEPLRKEMPFKARQVGPDNKTRR